MITSKDCDFSFRYDTGIYYALKEGGVWRCDADKNISNTENWVKIEDQKLLDAIVFSNDKTSNCWIIDENKVIHILNTDGSYKRTSSRRCYEQLKASGPFVFSKGWGFDIIRADNQEISYVQTSPFSSCRDFYSVNDSTLYATHPTRGIVKLHVGFHNHEKAEISFLSDPVDYYEIAGNQINELAFGHGVLAGTSGYKIYAQGYTDMFITSANVNFFENGEWSHITEENVLAQPLATKEFRGLTNIACDTQKDHRFYVSTLTTGIYQFDGDSLTKHFLPTERITAVCCDEEGTLWTGKPYQDTTIWSYNEETEAWIPHAINGHTNQNNIGRIIRQVYEPHHLVWSLNNNNYRNSQIGILYNPGNSNDNTQDQSAYITSFQDQDGNIYSLSNSINYVYEMQEDKDGMIWLLSNIGPFVIEDVVSTFNYAQKNPGIGQVKRIKVPRNDGTNLADYLLSTASCTAMVVDQFNRKWIGTLGDGLYLLSSDGLREIAHFTTENAPLHTNDITSLAYDESENRLFIASDGGVIIYHADEITAHDDFESFHCYPNPVRPDYYGNITITGIMANSQITITDAVGNVVWKTYCEDGFAEWDGNNNDGDRVVPGIYLIHGISKESSKGKICKLLVL